MDRGFQGMYDAISTKANTTDVTNSLFFKCDKTLYDALVIAVNKNALATDVTASLALKGDLSLVNSVIASDALKAPLTGAVMTGPVTVNDGTSGNTFKVVGSMACQGRFCVYEGTVGIGTQFPASTLDIVGNTNMAGNLNINNGGIYLLNGVDVFAHI